MTAIINSLIVLTVLFFSLVTYAKDKTLKVAVVGVKQGSDFHGRLRAELAALGFETEIAAVNNTGNYPNLKAIAIQENSQAAVWLDQPSRLIQVWVIDPNSQKEVFREILVEGEKNPKLLALVAAEFLRSCFLEVGFKPPPKTKKTEPDLKIEKPKTIDFSTKIQLSKTKKTEPEPGLKSDSEIEKSETKESSGKRQLFKLAFDFLLTTGTGSFKITPDAGVVFGGRLIMNYFTGISLKASVPFLPSMLRRKEGTVRIWPFELNLGPYVNLRPDSNKIIPYLGVGLGGLIVLIKGDAKKGFLGQKTLVPVSAFYGEGGLRIKLSKHTAFNLAVKALWTQKKLVLLTNDREMAAWGNLVINILTGISWGIMNREEPSRTL